MLRAPHSRCLVLAVACLWLAAGCATTGNPPVGSGPPNPAPIPDPGAATGPSVGERAQSAVEGLLMGAIIGGQAGPIGAAVVGGVAMIYSAVTGDVPFSGGGGGLGGGSAGGGGGGPESRREAEMEQQIEDELARQDNLESEIEAELRRQEELLRQIEQDEALRQAGDAQAAAVPSTEELAVRTDPRAAPAAPRDRELPLSIFEEERRTIRKGEWGNPRKMKVLVRTLDADRDGSPEQIRYHDAGTGAIVRKEEDRDYDGRIDSWTIYESGLVAEMLRDNSGDGKADEWHRYGRDGLMVAREVDRDGDGVRDAFYRFEGGSLAEERHDTDSSGSIDRIVYYERRRIARTEEDRDRDGAMDTWARYRPQGDREVLDRIEKDTTGDGQRDTFETYEEVSGKVALKQRDEDKNADGVIDVKSIYENGKLKQREISDPALLPL